ncbi:hypothetical protein AVEN_154470-1 [Araneus ventricosus]|uniref:Uncharacterized protein n=1 Tax=Araneus ventricosus TaxID=182803 RepID=A0A4Y2R0U0_ARAVE|nr:hypothetical protein AVEN_154470-1 [Araneus ventricosus]
MAPNILNGIEVRTLVGVLIIGDSDIKPRVCRYEHCALYYPDRVCNGICPFSQHSFKFCFKMPKYKYLSIIPLINVNSPHPRHSPRPSGYHHHVLQKESDSSFLVHYWIFAIPFASHRFH